MNKKINKFLLILMCFTRTSFRLNIFCLFCLLICFYQHLFINLSTKKRPFPTEFPSSTNCGINKQKTANPALCTLCLFFVLLLRVQSIPFMTVFFVSYLHYLKAKFLQVCIIKSIYAYINLIIDPIQKHHQPLDIQHSK